MNNLIVGQPLKQTIRSNLSRFDSQTIKDLDKKSAAVAMVVTNCLPSDENNELKFDVGSQDHAAFILTIRSSKLKNHRGQFALPGGRIDIGETAEQAALRELEEEVGIELDASHILGRLDDYATHSGYVITPVVIWAGRDIELVANPHEVELIHRIPLKELLREDAPILETIPESEHPVLKMPVGKQWFAAPTAAIAFQFREVALLGKSTRVAHFEQPYFAWR